MIYYSSSLQDMILADEISLAPSVTTVYATEFFHAYTGTSEMMENENSILCMKGDVSLVTDTTDNSLGYETGNDHDSELKSNSLTVIPSHDNRFHNWTPSHEERTIMRTSTPLSVHTTNLIFLHPDNAHSTNTILSSFNDGYIGSEGLSLSASASQTALQTATLPICMSPSLSELSLDVELQREREEDTEEGSCQNLPGSDSCVHPDLAVMVPNGDVDSGYRQADLFLPPEASMFQPSLTANALWRRVSLDDIDANWEENAEEIISNPSSSYIPVECTHTPLLALQQSKDGFASSDSSACSKDKLCLSHSCGEHLDTVDFFVGKQSTNSQVLLDSSDYLKQNFTSSSLAAPLDGEEAISKVRLNVPTIIINGMGDLVLHHSTDLVTDCGLDCVSHARVHHTESVQEGSGYIHATTQLGQGHDDYIRSTMQLVQDGEGYAHSDLQPFPGVGAKSTKDPMPCYDNDFDKEDLLLIAGEGNHSIGERLPTPGSKSAMQTNLAASKCSDHIECDVLDNVQPVQPSSVSAVCSRSISNCNGYIKSTGLDSIPSPDRVLRPPRLTTDDYVYT